MTAERTEELIRRDGAPTMRDVAAHAGVSLKTVSRVVNMEPRVHPDTAARVRQAIGALGFRPNDIARSLRPGQSSSTLGLVIEDLSNPFYSVIARAVEEMASAGGCMVLMGSSEEDPERERSMVTALLRRRVEGLLVVPAGTDHTYLTPSDSVRTPIVFLDRPPGNLEADVVLLDDRRGAREGVTHLLQHGHRRVGFIADLSTIYTAKERLAGYQEALAAAGIPFDQQLVLMDSRNATQASRAVTQLLGVSNPPTAFFTGNNRNSAGALLALRAAGSTAALVGFDDFEFADVLGITVVAHDPAEMGRRATELLFTRMHDHGTPPSRHVIPTHLVERGSGEMSP